ncbi:SDR family NAD(P)-dependent oxidoreductase [Ktedonospora formicarum]|uniref:Short-chain dehydrogenase n=1 Tax=Ktedonospora formicarum TaxID=2778364 RepID=A0A8J3I9N4_9CHLR|nr:short-chain dehydrogenase [Ktedonospora formicarum]
MRLQGKTALVTGATSGIGQAIAQVFVREGAQVIITGRNKERGQAVVEAIRLAGGSAVFIAANLASQRDIESLAVQALNAFGRIDILVNNAGLLLSGATGQTDEATFDAVVATNFKAPFYLTAALAPQMAERRAGKIINITTISAHRGFPTASLYGATKAALTLLTKAWASEFGPNGINVNAIAPGPVRTPGAEESMGERLDQVASMLPARRVGFPSEIAEAALYLASEEASFIHGAILPIDGGRLAI